MNATLAPAPVKSSRPARPFGAGILPEAAPIARHRVAVHATPLGAELRSFLRSMFYPACSVGAVVDHVGTHATAAGCGLVSAADVSAIDGIIARHAPAPAVVRDEAPQRKPAAFRPSDEDSRWWAAESARLESARSLPAGRRTVGTYASISLNAMHLGVIPVELAESVMSRSLVGHEG